MTVSAAARHIGVSAQTLRRWSDQGAVECRRTPGGQRRFSREALDRLTERLRTGGVD